MYSEKTVWLRDMSVICENHQYYFPYNLDAMFLYKQTRNNEDLKTEHLSHIFKLRRHNEASQLSVYCLYLCASLV